MKKLLFLIGPIFLLCSCAKLPPEPKTCRENCEWKFGTCSNDCMMYYDADHFHTTDRTDSVNVAIFNDNLKSCNASCKRNLQNCYDSCKKSRTVYRRTEDSVYSSFQDFEDKLEWEKVQREIEQFEKMREWEKVLKQFEESEKFRRKMEGNTCQFARNTSQLHY